MSVNINRQPRSAEWRVIPANNGLLNKLKSLVPSVCGGGGFGYGGAGGHAGPVHGEILGLVEYDSRLGGAHAQGTTISYGYDTAGRPTSVTSNWVDSQHPATLALVNSSYGYYPTGQLRVMTLGNGLTEANVFTGRLEPCRKNWNSSGTFLNMCWDADPTGTVQSFYGNFGTWGSNDNGNLTYWSATGTQSFNRTYTYDGVNRLATMSSPNDPSGCTGLSFSYDIWGNRTSQQTTGGSCGNFNVSFAQGNNRMDGYSYDAAGNLLNDGSHAYTYDAENHITAVDGGTTAAYTYDAEGRRVHTSSTNNTYNIDYFYDLGGRPLSRWDNYPGFTGWGFHNIYMGDRLLAQYAAGSTLYLHQDHLGSTRLQTWQNQSVCQSYDYLPFGEQISGGWCTSMKFTGKERDSESNLDNFGARYYSSQFGRFMSPDVINLTNDRLMSPSTTLNKYVYAADNPLKYVDPDGKDITIFYRPPSCTFCTDFGHIYLGALNQATGQTGFLDYYPQNGTDSFGNGPGAFNTGNMQDRAAELAKYASLTIQTTPEEAQKVLDFIKQLTSQPASDYHALSNNCTTVCEDALHDLGLDSHNITPTAFWNAIYRSRSKFATQHPILNSLAKALGISAPSQGGTDYGNPRDFGVGDFDQFLFELYLNQQQQPPPTATVCTDDGLGNQSCSQQ